MDAGAIQAIHSLIEELQSAANAMVHAQNIDYVVPDIDPDSVEYATGDWDASDAVASYPNPGEEDVDMSTFRKNYLLAPPMDSDEAEVKSAYSLPIRNSHGGAVNVNSLEAVQAAINGARGGVKGVSEDTLRTAYNSATQMRVASGDLEEADDAPDFKASDSAGADQDLLQASSPFTAQIEAESDPDADPSGLEGIIWASGTHDLWVNGEATRVHVPEDTIPDTFERLQQRMQAGEPPKIGFDHPDPESVAAKTPLGEIGVGQEFVQASQEDRESIVMKDSEFTNNKAVEAAEAGGFDGMGFSIVGNISIQTDDDGNPVQRDDGALKVAATEVQRIDVVPDQAVEGAKNGNLPEAAAAAYAAGRVAAANPNGSAEGFAHSLRAAAGEIETDVGDTSHMTDDDFPTDPDSLEAAKTALNQASDVVESKEEKIEDLEGEVSDLQGEAEHFRQIAASHGIDPDGDDFEAQAVIDAHTEDLRKEIADLEAALPAHDTEDVQERAEDLAGSSISELEAMVGERWREFGRSQAKRSELSVAVAAEESVGSVDGAGGSSGGGSDADEAAKGVLRARELKEANDQGQSPADYVEANFGVEPTEYSSEHELQAQITRGAN